MTKSAFIALNAQQFAAPEANKAPDWVHLLPTSKGAIATGDSRGPYNVSDAQAIIDASFRGLSKLPIDENHAIDLAAPKGQPAPARGWITEMQTREDGIWGKVEWTEEGERLVASKAYFGLSPVITLPSKNSKEIVGIQRASLVNRPNLRGLTALHQENDEMPFREDVAGLLGLDASASEDDIKGVIEGLKGSTALQSQMGELHTIFGVAEGGDIIAAAKQAKTSAAGEETAITALQSTVTDLQTTVTELQSENADLKGERKKDRAVTFVDGAIKAGRVGVKPKRDEYIEMHQENPTRVEDLIAALPIMTASGTTEMPPETGEVTELNAEQLAGKASIYQTQQAEAGINISFTEAVRAVQEGKA